MISVYSLNDACATLKNGKFTGETSLLQQNGAFDLLNCAISSADGASLFFLIENGIQLNNEHGAATLRSVISKSQVEMVYWLVNNGVKPLAIHISEGIHHLLLKQMISTNYISC